MKASRRNKIALSFVAAWLAAAACTAEAKDRPLDLAQAMDLIAKTYPGRVISGQTDASGGDRLHHHVDILLTNGRVAKFDIDATSQRIYNRLPPEDAPAAAITMEQAVRKVQKDRGTVLAAEFDPDPAPHYHMTVREKKGVVSRLDVDVATGEAKPHRPRT